MKLLQSLLLVYLVLGVAPVYAGSIFVTAGDFLIPSNSTANKVWRESTTNKHPDAVIEYDPNDPEAIFEVDFIVPSGVALPNLTARIEWTTDSTDVTKKACWDIYYPAVVRDGYSTDFAPAGTNSESDTNQNTSAYEKWMYSGIDPAFAGPFIARLAGTATSCGTGSTCVGYRAKVVILNDDGCADRLAAGSVLRIKSLRLSD